MTKKLTCKLIERGYAAKEIISKLPFSSKASSVNKTKKDKRDAPLAFPTKFSDICKDIMDIIKQHWTQVESVDSLLPIFPKRPMLAYKKNKSLANILVRSKLKDPTPEIFAHLSQRPHRTDPKPKVNQDIDRLFPKGYPMKKCGVPKCKLD